MSDQTTFTPEEWSQIRTAPLLVTTGVTAADPSGIFGSIKEAAAGMNAMIASLQSGGPSGLLGSLLADKSAPSLPDFKSMLGEGDKAKQMSNLKTAILGKIWHLGYPEAEGLAGGSDVVHGHALEGGRQCGERGEGRRIPRLRRHSRERPGTGFSRRVESGAPFMMC